MKQEPAREQTLVDAIAAVRDDEAREAVADAAAARVWRSLAPHAAAGFADVAAIRGCADVRALLPALRHGELPAGRALLVEDHLRECAECRSVLREPDGPRLAVLPWRPSAAAAPAATVARQQPRRVGRLAIAAVVVLAAVAGSWAARQRLAVPAGSRATVQSVSGTLHRLHAGASEALAPGAELAEGEVVRTARGSRAVLRLRDGSSVEMGERAELAVTARGQDTTVRIERGSLIVSAAKRRTGHLRVASSDCTVSVTGTLFAVNRGIKGSRVSVLEGEVRVAQGGDEKTLAPGDQWTSGAAVLAVPLAEEVAWSTDAEKHLLLLAEWKELGRKWGTVAAPPVRHEAPLVPVLPEDTVAFASLPNYGESLAQAHQLFEERLRESRVLREWWREVDPSRHGAPSLAQMIDRIRGLASFLGDEVVFAAEDGGRAGGVVPLLVAEVRKPGLREHLEELLRADGASGRDAVVILDEAAPAASSARKDALFVLLRPGLVAVALDAPTLWALAARRESGSDGLDGTPFGRRILDSYTDGVGLLFAADLERMSATIAEGGAGDAAQREALRRSGFDTMRYLVVERKPGADASEARAVLAFGGARRGLASWLAAPAPMGSLGFVSAHAQGAAAFVIKSPALVFDDFMDLLASADANAHSDLERLEARLSLGLREDLAATLGGEFAMALDGPLLPTPSWKLVVEVYDPARLQASLERLVADANDEAVPEGRAPLELQAEQLDGQTYHSLRGDAPLELHYAFATGYLVVAPSRALVMAALRTFESGSGLGGSASFRALFPPDRDAHVSALLYQNMGGVLQSLAGAPGTGALGSEARGALESLGRDARAQLVAVYGEEEAIRVAGSGQAMSFDPSQLALPLLVERAIGGLSRTAQP